VIEHAQLLQQPQRMVERQQIEQRAEAAKNTLGDGVIDNGVA
jgi:hypothetical protein